MTILTGTIKGKTTGLKLWLCHVLRFDMAALAQPRSVHDKKLFVIRAVRLVAVQAVFSNRGMFRQKRAALVGVALVTVLVHRCFRQEFIIRRAMRIMTIAALDLPLPKRHMG